MGNAERIKGFIGLTALTPVAGVALSGLSVLGTGIGNATGALVATGFMGHAAKMSGATNLFKMKK